MKCKESISSASHYYSGLFASLSFHDQYRRLCAPNSRAVIGGIAIRLVSDHSRESTEFSDLDPILIQSLVMCYIFARLDSSVPSRALFGCVTYDLNIQL